MLTRFEGGQNLATYHFENAADPAQLSRITNNFGEPYPAEIPLDYDDNGNLILDDAGRKLEYDALNRLIKVTDLEKGECLYGYDPQNILSSTDSEA
ncbi:RHS Repeat protein [compost metagenome]